MGPPAPGSRVATGLRLEPVNQNMQTIVSGTTFSTGKLWKASMLDQVLWTIALAFDNIQLYCVGHSSRITAHAPCPLP